MDVLVAHKTEKLVLDERAAERATRRVPVQFWHFFVAGNVAVLIVEIGRGIQPVGSAVNVSAAVNGVGAGGGAHVDVRAAGGSLLRVVHGGVDAKFLNGFWCGGWQGLADGQIRRRRA